MDPDAQASRRHFDRGRPKVWHREDRRLSRDTRIDPRYPPSGQVGDARVANRALLPNRQQRASGSHDALSPSIVAAPSRRVDPPVQRAYAGDRSGSGAGHAHGL
jgi:hypothetical protein